MNDKIIEYDKRIGVPKFEGWQDREIEFMKELAEDYCQCKTPLVNVDKPYKLCNN